MWSETKLETCDVPSVLRPELPHQWLRAFPLQRPYDGQETEGVGTKESFCCFLVELLRHQKQLHTFYGIEVEVDGLWHLEYKQEDLPPQLKGQCEEAEGQAGRRFIFRLVVRIVERRRETRPRSRKA